MANLTKAQVKKRLKNVIEQAQILIEDLEALKKDLASEISEIEPYSGFKNLTEVQQNRQEWLDAVAGQVSTTQEKLKCSDLENLL